MVKNKTPFLPVNSLRELKRLGIEISAETAEASWYPSLEDHETWTLKDNTEYPEPFWETREGKETYLTISLGGLLEMLPMIPGYYPPDLHRCKTRPDEPHQWMCVYEPVDLEGTTSKDWIKYTSESPLLAVFETIKLVKVLGFL